MIRSDMLNGMLAHMNDTTIYAAANSEKKNVINLARISTANSMITAAAA
jgi:hypothetical protein